MNNALAFRKKLTKDVMSPEKKEELKANISRHVQAYINSGGQIQQCTPCTFGAKEKVTKRQVAMNNKGTR